MMYFGQQGKEEDCGGKRLISFFYEQERIPFYQREILKSVGDELFIPMSFLFKNSMCQVYYDLSGLVPLRKKLAEMKTARMPSISFFCFQLVGSLMKKLWKAEDHLLFVEEFQFEMDVIFLDAEEQVQVAFFPAKKEGDAEEEVHPLVHFLTELEREVADPQWTVYSTYLCEKLEESHMGTGKLEQLLEKMKRELVYSL